MAELGTAISELTELTTASTDDQFLVVDGSETKRITYANLSKNIGVSLNSFTVNTATANTAALVYDSTTGTFVFTPPDLSPYATTSYVDSVVSGVNTGITNLTTSSVTEGTNKYFLNSRVWESITAGTGITFNQATGEIYLPQAVGPLDNVQFNDLNVRGTFTIGGAPIASFVSTEIGNLDTDSIPEGNNKYYSNAQVEAYLSGGTGVTYNNGVISIGQNVSTTSNVRFNDVTVGGNLFVTVNNQARNITDQIQDVVDTLNALNTTDDLDEGNNNEYFTVARARDSFRANTGITINKTTGDISIGQAVNTTSNVRFNDVRVDGTLLLDGVSINAVVGSLGSQISSLWTDGIPEGSTNLYFTPERARNSFTAGSGITISANGVISSGQSLGSTSSPTFLNLTVTNNLLVGGKQVLTADSLQSSLASITTTDVAEGARLYFTEGRARGSLVGGTGVSYNQSSGVIAIGQAVNTNSNVRFNNVSVDGALSINGTDILTTLSGATSALSSLDTDSISEGDNLFFTTARARSAISGGTGVSYNSSTGVMSIGQAVNTTSNVTFNNGTFAGSLRVPTIPSGAYWDVSSILNQLLTAVNGLDTDDVIERSGATNQFFTTARARSAISGGTGVSYNANTGVMSIGQAVGTTANVRFNDLNVDGTLFIDGTDILDTVSGTATTLSNLDSDDVAEGPNNLYFTNARARSAISAGTGVSYNSSTGVISIGQAVNTTSNVRFNDITATGTLTVDGLNVYDELTKPFPTSHTGDHTITNGSLTINNGNAGTPVLELQDYSLYASDKIMLKVNGYGSDFDLLNYNDSGDYEFRTGRTAVRYNDGYKGLQIFHRSSSDPRYDEEFGTNHTDDAPFAVESPGGIVRTTIRTELHVEDTIHAQDIDISGTATFGTVDLSNANVTLPTGLGFPVGGIIMWSGSIASIPSGWALCNGSNGTPDLRDRFVVGAGSSYNPGATGGANSVTLTTAQMPSHSHGSGSLTTNSAGEHRHTIKGSTASNGPFSSQKTAPQLYRDDAEVNAEDANSMNFAGNHSHTISGTTSSAGSGNAHENRPPYYALAYIMKIS